MTAVPPWTASASDDSFAPSRLEREIAAALANVLEMSATVDYRMLIGGVLASHRARCTALVEHTLEELSNKGLSDHGLQLMQNGWTPAQVHALVDGAREVRRGLRLAPQKIREALTERPDEPSTYAHLVALRERLAEACELAQALRGTGDARFVANVEQLIAALGG